METLIADFYHNATTFVSPEELKATLYAGVDFTQLNLFERAWVNWFEFIGNPILATGIFSFIMHEAVYFGRCIPWMILEQFRYFDKYRIQVAKLPSAAQQWKCTKAVLYTHFTVELPQIYLFYNLAASVGMRIHQVPFPPLLDIAMQIAVFFLMEDTWHYFIHRLAHHRRLYKYVHKVHHEFSAPFGLAAEYAHPVEVLVLGLGTVGSPLIYSYFVQDSAKPVHIITMYLWIVLRLFQAIDAHSGYDFPWSLHNFLPFWAGAEHHDYHHQFFMDCYSSSFRHWDWILKTDLKYHAYRAKQLAARALAKTK